MKEKVLHIVDGPSSRWVLEHGKITDEIVVFPLYLSFGHIPRDFTDQELCFSMMSLYNWQKSDRWFEEFPRLKRMVNQDYSSFDKVVVWHGGGAHELLLLYMMAVLTENNLYHVDIRDNTEFMKKMKSMKNPYMGDVSPYDISTFNMSLNMKTVSPQENEEYRKMWHEWTKSKAPYRFTSLVSDCIKEYTGDFMDETILDVIEEEMDQRRIIGSVMGRFMMKNMRIPDAVIHNRIMELVLDGKINRSVLLSVNRTKS